MGRSVHFFGLLDRWNARSLAWQFLLSGGLISFVAAIGVGAAVGMVIERAVTQNSAASTALYVDSIIAPLLPDMQSSQELGEGVIQALDETLSQGALSERLMTFKLWRKDGTILYSNDKNLMGRKFELSEDLRTAFTGKIVAEFDQLDDIDSSAERDSGQPLLEIYNPVLQPWSGEVVAVSEFYEVADDFQHSLNHARRISWLAIFGFTICFFLSLSALVFRGSRVIDSQRQNLKERIGELSDLLSQNEVLRARVQRASQRTSALNERYLRRIGADLHDGPAQLLALAALRIDSPYLKKGNLAPAEREEEISAIKAILDEAMQDIRNLCTGLVLPQIEAAGINDVLMRVVQAHEQRTGTRVDLQFSHAPQPLSVTTKICVFRFVQEALNNGFRHGGGVAQRVTQSIENGRILVEVRDGGPGFDPDRIGQESLGLAGLRERVESLGGRFDLSTSADGTVVTMSLDTRELEAA
ncbi:sensor histidine kinase [Pararhizobium gei]|uniref:sensor histidine kinase n=1 Tax=Pararhizobium gei TaxID=1395951 RepID=UPI0023DB2E63|nr:sensor histidine kinase [Rhizobium gei]